jgi:hypothetical protein
MVCLHAAHGNPDHGVKVRYAKLFRDQPQLGAYHVAYRKIRE